MAEHPRTRIVEEASSEIERAIHQIRSTYGLTRLELLRVLNNCEDRILKHALRAERHPEDPTQAADEE